MSKSDLSVEAMAAADADDFVEPPSKKKSHLKIGETTEILVRTLLLTTYDNKSTFRLLQVRVVLHTQYM